MTRRQVLKSLCAAALAAVAPIPAMGAAAIPFRKNVVDFDNGTVEPCPCCSDVTFDPDKFTIEIVGLDCPSWKMSKYELERIDHETGMITYHWTKVGE